MKSTEVDDSLSTTSTDVLFQRIPTNFKMGHQDFSLSHVKRELILYFSLNFVSTTIQTQVKVVGWECLPKLFQQFEQVNPPKIDHLS